MKKSVINNSLMKKFVLIFSFVVNMALLLLTAFLWHFWIYLIASGVSLVVYIVFLSINKHIHNKLLWLIVVSALPIYGTVLYLLGKYNSRYLHSRTVYQNLQFRNSEEASVDCEEILKSIKKHSIRQYKLSRNILSNYNSPVFQNSSTKFLESGQQIYDELFNELKQAESYIFIEQYVIREGKIWDQLFEILKQKARQGVEVKILYDPLGCKNAFTDKLTFQKLANYKIDCVPFKNGVFGYGNHRKLVVIDGIVAFVGSFNISDRYTGYSEVDNNWELSALKISGDAVWNMTVGFFNDWQFSKGKLLGDFINYKPENSLRLKSSDVVQPIITSPLTNNDETKTLLISLINSANEKIDIFSSFINVDADILDALKHAVNSGVEVNIITSSTTDRDTNFAISRGHYYELIRAGVNVLEHPNTFLRSRMIVVDHETAMVGSIGLDTRWLHLKFENAVVIHGKETLKNITRYAEVVKHACKLFTLKDFNERPLQQKITAWAYRLFRLNF